MSKDNITHIDEYKTHYAIIILCLACRFRWFGTVAQNTSLFKLECPQCREQDSFASFLPDEYLDEC